MKTQGELHVGTKVGYEAKWLDHIRAALTQFSPFRMQYKSNDWFLYAVQHWAGMG